MNYAWWHFSAIYIICWICLNIYSGMQIGIMMIILHSNTMQLISENELQNFTKSIFQIIFWQLSNYLHVYHNTYKYIIWNASVMRCNQILTQPYGLSKYVVECNYMNTYVSWECDLIFLIIFCQQKRN